MNYAVILAGGSGRRLWPLSREKRPKQVLKLLDGRTLLELCYERLSAIFDTKNILVMTNAAYADVVRENLPALPCENIIAEPAVRDTAGAVGLISTVLAKYDPDATFAVVTADQVISPAEILQQVIKDALAFVNEKSESMVVFGIQPGFASTSFGYIKCVNPQQHPCSRNSIYSVEAFKEKPDGKTAQEYINSGSYFWNSGMFVWKARTVLSHLAKFLPESIEPLNKISTAWGGPNQQGILSEWFLKLPKISIDYAVMEKADNVYAIRLNCRWFDMGSFAALADVVDSDENNNIIVAGQSSLIDCRDNIIITEEKGHLIAAIGLDSMVVVQSPDATLVCPLEQADRLKELLDKIKQDKGNRFL